MKTLGLGGLRQPVLWSTIIGGIAQDLAALGPTGSPKRRRTWTEVVTRADDLRNIVLRRGLLEEVQVVLEVTSH